MNDNEIEGTEFWVQQFVGFEPKDLRAALGVLAGLIDDPEPFLNCARAINIRRYPTKQKVMMADIMYEVCRKHDLSYAQMIAPIRTKRYSHPRQELMFRVFTECPHLSYTEMARRLGGRDHTTCVHGVRAHCKRVGIEYVDAVAMRLLAAKEQGRVMPPYRGACSALYAAGAA